MSRSCHETRSADRVIQPQDRVGRGRADQNARTSTVEVEDSITVQQARSPRSKYVSRRST
jgi:hypothetical protein